MRYAKYVPQRDAPPKPVWYRNLEKAWASNRALKIEREATKLKEENQTLPNRFGTSIREAIADDDELWHDRCNELHTRRKPGRPRMKPEDRKNNPRIKRSDKMKKLLLENGITVDEENNIHNDTGLYIGWKFQINGRVKFDEEPPISVHKFLSII